MKHIIVKCIHSELHKSVLILCVALAHTGKYVHANAIVQKHTHIKTQPSYRGNCSLSQPHSHEGQGKWHRWPFALNQQLFQSVVKHTWS